MSAKSGNSLATVLVAAAIVAALYFGREVLLPMALAVLLSFVLAPRSETPSALVFTALCSSHDCRPARVRRDLRTRHPDVCPGQSTGWGFTTLSVEFGGEDTSAPRRGYGERDSRTGFPGAAEPAERTRSAKKRKTRLLLQRRTRAPLPDRPIPVEVRQPDPGALQTLATLIAPLIHPLATTGLIIIFVVFILLQQQDLRNRLIRLAGSHDLQRTTLAMDDAGKRLSLLFLMQLALNAAFGLIIGVGLWAIGVPSAPLWGLLAMVLRFVPYIGAIVAAIFPLIVATAVDPGWSMMLMTAALFLVVEPLIGHVIEPIVYGHSSGLSPVAVVVSATFWTWLWGPIGLILATPLTMCLVVLGRHVERLNFWKPS